MIKSICSIVCAENKEIRHLSNVDPWVSNRETPLSAVSGLIPNGDKQEVTIPIVFSNESQAKFIDILSILLSSDGHLFLIPKISFLVIQNSYSIYY